MAGCRDQFARYLPHLSRGRTGHACPRQGLPSSVGEALLKSPDYEIYVRDRSPQARFTGRNYVLPEDVFDMAADVMRHRLVLSYQALAEEVAPDAILDAVLAKVPVPRIDLTKQPAAA